jgi:hypothetical protein
MAKVTLHSAIARLQGKFGDVVFKQINGKLYATRSPRRRKTKPTADEKKRRKRFRAAHKYAQKVIADPALKAGYAAAAKRHRRRIYNLALSDYLTEPKLTTVMSEALNGVEHLTISTPNDYKIVAMHLVLRDVAGKMIERGEPVKEKKSWSYSTARPRRTAEPLTVEIIAADRLGKTTRLTTQLELKR